MTIMGGHMTIMGGHIYDYVWVVTYMTMYGWSHDYYGWSHDYVWVVT